MVYDKITFTKLLKASTKFEMIEYMQEFIHRVKPLIYEAVDDDDFDVPC